jgi:hypothetical protein
VQVLELRQLASDPSVPVEGGSANDYEYTNGDPVNASDLSGEFPVGIPVAIAAEVIAFRALAELAESDATPAWRKYGLSRCPTRKECQTATKLLKGAIGYADKYGRRLSPQYP